ncbi:MAG TPA: sterol carrier family protein [Intrasporangium sp.]|uniref:sterol carrier family protein n=1 Tax=Intrasporangium sp. TaxID=1925024 RepID=UPI002D77FA1D|nr:sterol carrier family protein [Intrasporangium sp.]HET7397888.1 sterol carrier family protein [Intrasporangium sp.]
MPPRRRTPAADGLAALDVCRSAGFAADRSAMATAVRFTLEELAATAPGRTVEVRVPPFGAVQCVEGPVHTRGTPPNVIETDPATWLRLATGDLSWDDAVGSAAVRASGQRAHLNGLLPLASLTLDR